MSQSVTDIHTGKTVQVIETQQVFGMTTYKVFEPDTGRVYSASEKSLSANTAIAPVSEAYIRYAAIWCRVRNELAGGTVFDVSESVIPLPHQRYALERALARNEVRYMLADEVGLGKTIEAGLIIKELQARGLIERVLVVCPKGLMTQWQAEMQEKFGERFTLVLPEDYATLKKVAPDQNVFTQFSHVISPMDAIKPLDEHVGWDQVKIDQYNADRIEAVVAGGWDLIIIDEAHHVAGSTNEVARHRLGDMLSKASPHLLLLTATPHSGKTEPFLRLMRLLDEDAFPNTKAIVREQVAPYLIRTEKREAVDNDGNVLFKKRHTQLMEIAWEARHSLQRELYEQVTEYVRTGYNKAIRDRKQYIGFLMILMQRLVSSSTSAILDALQRRVNALRTQADQLHVGNFSELVDSNMEESIEEALMLLSTDLQDEILHLERLLSLAKQANLQGMDAKAEVLMDLLQKLLRQEPESKIIVFTEFVMTQRSLQQLAAYHGISSTLINGSMSLDERNASLEDFRREKQILISTDAGGEGLNLQFSHIVVNYDLPWNPMKIEQRIGRADRIGQQADVQVYNFILKDTVENRVRDVLEMKLAIILKELGIDKLQDVLDDSAADMDFTNVYISSIVNPRYQGAYADELSKNIEKQVAQAEQIRNVIKDDKELVPDQNAERAQHSFHALLREMLYNHQAWKGYALDRRFDLELSVSDTRIQQMLQTKQTWHARQGLPIVSFPQLTTEQGVFSLWEIALSEDTPDKRIIPIFVNSVGVYRLPASRIIWEELLKPHGQIIVSDTEELPSDQFNSIQTQAQAIAAETFRDMRVTYVLRHENNYQKMQRALSLRIEAAQRIGIENIREARIRKLEIALAANQAEYERHQDICPSFVPVLILHVR
jgi:superfamily II DNA or RNA helicase